MLDTETTGLTKDDRLITLGAVSLEDGELVAQRTLYLIFDPMTKSNPFAQRVHGFDESTCATRTCSAAMPARFATGLAGQIRW